MCRLPLVREVSLILELLMLEPLLVLEFALDPVPVVLLLAPPVPPAALVLAPPLMEDPLVLEPLVLEPLLIEPLLIEPVLSVVAGATAPPAVDVSVVLALLFLLHAATATRAAARIAMRFMKSSGVSIIRERCATFSASMHSCIMRCGGNKRTPVPRIREGRNQRGCALCIPREEAGYGFLPIFFDVSFFIVESVFVVVVVVVVIALSCFVVSIMAGAGLMAGAATTAVSAGAESLALQAAMASTAATTARRFIETLLLEGDMWSTLRPSTSVGAMPGASGG